MLAAAQALREPNRGLIVDDRRGRGLVHEPLHAIWTGLSATDNGGSPLDQPGVDLNPHNANPGEANGQAWWQVNFGPGKPFASGWLNLVAKPGDEIDAYTDEVTPTQVWFGSWDYTSGKSTSITKNEPWVGGRAESVVERTPGYNEVRWASPLHFNVSMENNNVPLSNFVSSTSPYLVDWTTTSDGTSSGTPIATPGPISGPNGRRQLVPLLVGPTVLTSRHSCLTVAVCCVLVAGLFARLPGPAAAHAPAFVSPPQCGQDMDWPQAPSLRAAKRELVPPGVVAIRLCRYAGERDPGPLHLLASRLITRASTVASLERGWNSLRALRPGTPPPEGCSPIAGRNLVAWLAYPGHRALPVVTEYSLCWEALNGASTRQYDRPFWNRLRGLVGGSRYPPRALPRSPVQ